MSARVMSQRLLLFNLPLLFTFSCSYGWFGSGGAVFQFVAVCVSLQVSWIPIQVNVLDHSLPQIADLFSSKTHHCAGIAGEKQNRRAKRNTTNEQTNQEPLHTCYLGIRNPCYYLHVTKATQKLFSQPV